MSFIGNLAGRGGRSRRNQARKCWYNPYKKKVRKYKHKIIQLARQNNFKMSKKTYQGDTKWTGDKPSGKSKREHTRFMLLNCKGLDVQKDLNYKRCQIQCLLETQSHYIGLTEINTNRSNKVMQQKVLETISTVCLEGIAAVTNSATRDPTLTSIAIIIEVTYTQKTINKKVRRTK